MGDQRRIVTLIGVSVAIHAVALGIVATLPAPVSPARASRAIEMEFLRLVEETPPPPKPVAVEPVVATVVPSKRKVVSTVAPVTPTSSNESAGSGPSVGPVAVGPRGDLPVANPSLVPSSGFIMQLGPAGNLDSGRGTTLKNGPGAEPDKQSLNDYTGEVLTRKLNSDLREQVGLAAVEVGNVPTHFKRYELAMRTALPKAKIDRSPMATKDALADAAQTIFNSGPSAEAQKKIADTATGRSVMNQNVMSPNIEDQRSREASLGMLAQVENIKEQIHRPRLRTVLEVTTDAQGVLADVSIIERSGDVRFDESVMHFSRKVARGIPESDDKLLGTSMWRTRWQFTWEPPEVKVRLINAWRLPE